MSSMRLPCIVEISTLISYSGLYGGMTNSGLNVMNSVMFPSSSECFSVQCYRAERRGVPANKPNNYKNTDSSCWFLCIFISLVKKNLIINQTADLLLYSSRDYCITSIRSTQISGRNTIVLLVNQLLRTCHSVRSDKILSSGRQTRC